MINKKPGLFTAASIVIGCVIGSGVFVKPGRVLLATGNSTDALLAWIFGGLITLAAGLTVSEIAFRIPKTGGVYTYIEELYGKSWGFVCGWVQTIIYGPGLSSALSLYFASLFTQFFNLPSTQVKPIALIALFFLSAMSAFGIRYSAWIQNSTTLLKLVPIALLGIAGLFFGHEPIFGISLLNAAPATGMGAAILATLWAYDGWIQVANVAGEIENPAKNLPRAVVGGLILVMVAYLLVNFSLFHVLPKDQIALLNERSAAVAAETLFGTFGGKALSLVIVISIFGCLNGNILTLSRVSYAMATRGVFPYKEYFAKLHPAHQTPVNSILLKVLFSTIMILCLNPDRITDIAIFSMYIFYAVLFLGIFKVRKIYGVPQKGEYRVPFYPVIPLLAFAGAIYIIVSTVIGQPIDALTSIGISLLGYPVARFLLRNETKSR